MDTGKPQVSSNEKVCADELQLIEQHGQPYGIRDRSGYLFFFTQIQKFDNQEQRYSDETAQRARLAAFLLSALRSAHEPEVGGLRHFVEWAAGAKCDDEYAPRMVRHIAAVAKDVLEGHDDREPLGVPNEQAKKCRGAHRVTGDEGWLEAAQEIEKLERLLIESRANPPQWALRAAQPPCVQHFDEENALDTFREYFVKNYPGPDTIITVPNWHVPKIFRAVLHAIKVNSAAQPPLPEYDMTIGERGEAYLKARGFDPKFLPGTFYWQEFWDAMRGATPRPRRAHQWDGAGERCVACGDKDWMETECQPDGPSSGPTKRSDDHEA